jgi:4-hydroxy-tetrahydrodipicolinate synthase
MTVLGGLLVPLVTPFADDGCVDLAALERLGEEVLEAGADGLVALATTAEASSLDERERDDVVAVCAAVAADRGAALIVGAGTNDTRTTIARHEALGAVAGVTASLAVVPYYVRPTEAAIVAHFQTVAARSPVPLVLYNIPYRTGRGLGAQALLELAGTAGIVGVKQAVGAVDIDTLQLLAQAPADFAVLCGDDAFLLPLLLMGAAGAIAASSHLCTERFAALIADARAGRLDGAREHAEALLPLVLALFAEPSPAVLKAMLHDAGRIPTPAVRMPLQAASRAAVQHARRSAPARWSAPAPARARRSPVAS